MNWVNMHKLPAIETVKHNRSPCVDLDDFWQALHSSFNSAQFQTIDKTVLNELGPFLSSMWKKFSEEEFTRAITNCCDSLSSGPDKLLWGHLKSIIKDKACLKNIISITDICFNLGYWPSHFKISSTIIISKPNKLLRSMPLENSMDMGKGYDDMIGCTICSLSQRLMQ